MAKKTDTPVDKLRVQYEAALRYQESEQQKRTEDAERLRVMALGRVSSYVQLMVRVHDLVEKGRMFAARETMHESLSWAGTIVGDLERAYAAERSVGNPMLVPLSHLRSRPAKKKASSKKKTKKKGKDT